MQNRENVVNTLVKYKKLAKSKEDKEVFTYVIEKILAEKNKNVGKKFVRLGDGTRKLIPEKKALRLLKKPVSERVV
jgi:hypothetical protein